MSARQKTPASKRRVNGRELAASPCSPLELLREILAHDRAAINAMKLEAPWYSPSDDILELHRKIEACLAANDGDQRRRE